MARHAYRGTVITGGSLQQMKIVEGGWIVVNDGIIEDVYDSCPDDIEMSQVTDFGANLIIPSFSDLHIHGSQFVERGTGMDCLLFDWLNNYTFPQEAGFKDTRYAYLIYSQLIRDLLRNGTTQAALFTTIHYDSCDLLFRMLMESGMYAYSGKINMDRNSPDYYVEDTDESIADTERFIVEHQDLSQKVKPIITPRFAPTCSRKLLAGLGKLAGRYDVGMQTHVVESRAESAWAHELFPEYASDSEIYEKLGLLDGKGVKLFAHVIFPTETEERIIKERDVISVHCPDATTSITAGIMPAYDMLEKGMKIAMGSDIGGGHFSGIYRQIARAVQLSKMKEFYEPEYHRLVFAKAFYMATAYGGSAFGNIGKLEKGYRFNALVIENMQDEGYIISPQEALERFCYSGDDRNILHRYVDGNEIDPEKVFAGIRKKFEQYERSL